MKIFISYRRADSTYLIGRIRDRLMAAFGDKCVFQDLDDIPAGVDFRTVLEKETNGCNVMLVVIGPQCAGITDAKRNKRLFDPIDYTRIEVETGLKRLNESKITVIPVLVMNAPLPSSHELPESIRQLTYQNAINIRNDPDFNNDIEKLIRDMRGSQGYAEEDISTIYSEPKTIYIAEGPFWMGSSAGPEIPNSETPQHQVDLPSYRIGKFPVTNGRYEEFINQTRTEVSPVMGWNGQKPPNGLENYPVTAVTWYEALAYCQWFSEKTARKYSLSNEAQWEKACRGGILSRFPLGDDFDSKRCNHNHAFLASVDAYPAQNQYGLFDLVGNVRQWTHTLWGEKHITPDLRYTYPWKNDTQ